MVGVEIGDGGGLGLGLRLRLELGSRICISRECTHLVLSAILWFIDGHLKNRLPPTCRHTHTRARHYSTDMVVVHIWFTATGWPLAAVRHSEAFSHRSQPPTCRHRATP